MSQCIIWMLVLLVSIGSTAMAEATVGDDDQSASTDIVATAMPAWLSAHFEFMTDGSGVWETDNGPYLSEAEPFVRYQTCWRYGVGDTSLAGALTGIRKDNSSARLWEYRLYWHTLRGEAVMSQWGAWNTFLSGPVMPHGTDGHESIQQQVNWDGSTARVRHLTIEEGQTHRTTSFGWTDNDWQANREYVWRRVQGGPCQP